MRDVYFLSKSKAQDKKWSLSDGNKTVNFGQQGFSDYTIHKTKQRQINYIKRHKATEQQFFTHTRSNLMRPSYLSRYILWQDPDIDQAIHFVEKKQGIQIIKK